MDTHTLLKRVTKDVSEWTSETGTGHMDASGVECPLFPGIPLF